MSQKPTEIVSRLLQNTLNPNVIRELVHPDSLYVSLNYNNPDLHKVMPWEGTHANRGPQGIIETFDLVNEYWIVEEFDTRALFGEGENVAAFGSFRLRSRRLDKAVTSPFAIWCKVSGGQVTYMQFMEDTFATASTFRSGGKWVFHSDPAEGGEEVEV